jgi:integral membrane protein (TIGR01906 family)
VLRAAALALAGFVLALLAVGVSLLPTLHPAMTANLVHRYASTQDAGLSKARVLELAEQVRGFVVDGRPDTLPAEVDGRSGFDDAAVSHLRDVRGVLFGARALVGVLALVAIALGGMLFSRKRFAEISSAMLWGSGLTLGGMALAATAAAADFSATFALFHGVFFSAGTWTFSADALLIQLFPVEFWSTMGAIWATLAGVLGLALGVAGWLLRRAIRSGA